MSNYDSIINFKKNAILAYLRAGTAVAGTAVAGTAVPCNPALNDIISKKNEITNIKFEFTSGDRLIKEIHKLNLITNHSSNAIQSEWRKHYKIYTKKYRANREQGTAVPCNTGTAVPCFHWCTDKKMIYFDSNMDTIFGNENNQSIYLIFILKQIQSKFEYIEIRSINKQLHLIKSLLFSLYGLTHNGTLHIDLSNNNNELLYDTWFQQWIFLLLLVFKDVSITNSYLILQGFNLENKYSCLIQIYISVLFRSLINPETILEVIDFQSIPDIYWIDLAGGGTVSLPTLLQLNDNNDNIVNNNNNDLGGWKGHRPSKHSPLMFCLSVLDSFHLCFFKININTLEVQIESLDPSNQLILWPNIDNNIDSIVVYLGYILNQTQYYILNANNMKYYQDPYLLVDQLKLKDHKNHWYILKPFINYYVKLLNNNLNNHKHIIISDLINGGSIQIKDQCFNSH